MKRLFDGTGQLWLEGALEGKPAGGVHLHGHHPRRPEPTCLTMMVPCPAWAASLWCPYWTPGMLHTAGRGGSPSAPAPWPGRATTWPPRRKHGHAQALGRRVAEVTRKLRG